MRFTQQEFLITVVRDGSKEPHSASVWAELKWRLRDAFGGYTDKGFCIGEWRDSDGVAVQDQSAVVVVGFDLDDYAKCADFAELIIWIKIAFDQQCIFCSMSNAALL